MIFCCIIILVAAVALQIMRIISGFQGASARACGSVGTCQSLTGAFFAIGAIFIVVKYGGDGLIGGVLQNYHARSKEIML